MIQQEMLQSGEILPHDPFFILYLLIPFLFRICFRYNPLGNTFFFGTHSNRIMKKSIMTGAGFEPAPLA